MSVSASNNSPNLNTNAVSVAAGDFLMHSSQYAGSDFALGNNIPAYRFDGNQFSEQNDTLYYPVYANDVVVAIYTTIGNDGASAFGKDFSDEINEAIESGATEFYLVNYDNKTYLCTEDSATIIFEHTPAAVSDTSEPLNVNPESATEEESLDVEVRTAQPTSDSAAITVTSEIGQNGMSRSVQSSNIDFETYNVAAAKLDITPATSPPMTRAGTYRYFSVPIANQGSTQLCWAVATTSIANYKYGSEKYSDTAFANVLGAGTSPQNIDFARAGLSSLYGYSSKFVNGFYPWASVKTLIEGGNLIYAAFYDTGWKYGHAVCVNGYYEIESNGIMVMESLGGYYRQIYPANSSGSYAISLSGINYWWYQSYYVAI